IGHELPSLVVGPHRCASRSGWFRWLPNTRPSALDVERFFTARRLFVDDDRWRLIATYRQEDGPRGDRGDHSSPVVTATCSSRPLSAVTTMSTPVASRRTRTCGASTYASGSSWLARTSPLRK